MKYDVAIIGAGPAGLMAAVRAGELGAKVIILEKNNRVGVKLLLTGGGRCNLTNKIEAPRDFIARLGKGGKFLFSALHKFGVKETLQFFQDHGLKIKVENNNRVFPASDKASDVLGVLLNELKKYQVEISTSCQVKKIITQNKKIVKIVLINGQEILSANFILATGGKSYPQTGSVGDGYAWLKQMKHQLVLPRPSLTPILVAENYGKLAEGLSVPDAKLNLYQDQKKIASTSGDVLFTASGLSGPAVLDLSRFIEPGKIKDLVIEVDFLPQFDQSALDKKLQQVLATSSKQLKNSLDNLVIPKYKELLFKLSHLNSEKKACLVSRQERLSLLKFLKNLRFKIKSVAGFDKAMVTSGGVVLEQIEPQTMRSKIISNLFVVGELLDLDGPTGGYNLQICWSTGYVAGETAA